MPRDSSEVRYSSRPVGASTGFTWWHTTDALWMAVNGGYGGTVCIPCFTRTATEKGFQLYWSPVLRGDGQKEGGSDG